MVEKTKDKSKDFFSIQTEQSRIKASIVSKYFVSWAKVMLSVKKTYHKPWQMIYYIDMFSGPGMYEDGNKSTPILILESISKDQEMSENVATVFYDENKEYIDKLNNNIQQVMDINNLRHKPILKHREINDDIATFFKNKNIPPTFFFVDPWGYKGLSLFLLSSIIKDWGCDCVFFFNYNRVRMGIDNKLVDDSMISLFGEDSLNYLRKEIKDTMSPEESENIIVKELSRVLKTTGGQYVLSFGFKSQKRGVSSHYLFFLCKSFKGYEIMKEIMHKESSDYVDGIASFGYDPRVKQYRQFTLHDLLNNLSTLKDMLMFDYLGQTIDFKTLYESHSIEKPYIRKNYKAALMSLLAEGKISAVNKKTGKPPKANTFSDDMVITFLR